MGRELSDGGVGAETAARVREWRDPSGSISRDVKVGFARTVERELERAGVEEISHLLVGAASDLADALIEFITRHNPHVRPQSRTQA